MNIDYKSVDFLVLLPCPMKAGFGRLANEITMRFAKKPEKK